MAGDWIEWECGLESKPEVLRMATAMKLDPIDVAGRCAVFWAWAQTHTHNGALPGVEVAHVDALVRTPGFAQNLISVSWLEEITGGVRIPSWNAHLSNSARMRKLQSRRASRYRHAAALRKRTKSATTEQNRTEPNRTEPITGPNGAALRGAGSGRSVRNPADEVLLARLVSAFKLTDADAKRQKRPLRAQVRRITAIGAQSRAIDLASEKSADAATCENVVAVWWSAMKAEFPALGNGASHD